MRFARILTGALTGVLAGLVLAGCAPMAKTEKVALTPSEPPKLFPSRWIAEDIAGAGLIDNSHVTLVFQADGAVSGSAGCNRYLGQAKLAGDRLTFAPLATTQMACAPALMDQEARYLAALGAGGTATLDTNGFLGLTGPGATKPTRFAPDTKAELKVSGTVTYLQRIALPPTASLEVRVEDVSLADAPAAVIAQQTVSPAGQVPIAFSLTIDPAKLAPKHVYAVRATLSDGKRLLFVTDTRYPVLEGGASSTVEIRVVPAR